MYSKGLSKATFLLFLYEWPCWWKLAWFKRKRNDIFTKTFELLHVKFWCHIPKSKLTKLLLAMFSRKTKHDFRIYSAHNKANHLDEKKPKWSQYHFNMILSVISDLRFFVKTENPQKSVLTMKIYNQEGFHLTASKYVCTQTKFQLFYKSNNKWHHT